jgi:DNA-directed RNA polymerase I and III subunit RPAC1
MYETIHSFILV